MTYYGGAGGKKSLKESVCPFYTIGVILARDRGVLKEGGGGEDGETCVGFETCPEDGFGSPCGEANFGSKVEDPSGKDFWLEKLRSSAYDVLC